MFAGATFLSSQNAVPELTWAAPGSLTEMQSSGLGLCLQILKTGKGEPVSASKPCAPCLLRATASPPCISPRLHLCETSTDLKA